MYLDHFDYPLVLFQGSKKKVEKKSEKETKAKLKDVSEHIDILPICQKTHDSSVMMKSAMLFWLIDD